MHNVLFDLYRSDQVLCDHEMNRYSFEPRNQSTTQRITEFDLCSDRMREKFPTYEFDKRCKVIPGSGTKLLNFAKLKDLLLSKDLERDSGFDKNGDFHFLDKADMTGNMVAFQSFPRCGNSFLRRFVE